MTPSDLDTASQPLGSVRCSAKSKRSGEQCKRWATRGLTVCAMHGGSTKRAKAKAVVVLAEREARRRLAIPTNVDPRDALTEELGRTLAWVRWLGDQVDAQDDVDLVWGKTKEVDKVGGPQSFGGVEPTHEAKSSVWWTMYKDERKHLVAIAKVAHECGVKEREVEIAVEQTRLLAEVVKGVLVDLGVFDDPRTPAVVRRHLAAIETNATSNEGATK